MTRDDLARALHASEEALESLAKPGQAASEVLNSLSQIARLTLPAQDTLAALAAFNRSYFSRMGDTLLEATRLVLPTQETLTAISAIGQRAAESAERAFDLLANLHENFQAALPPNLHELDEARGFRGIRSAAQIAEVEGIPIAWIPNGAIVAALIAEADALARVAFLVSMRDEVLADCELALDSVHNEWGDKTRDAIESLRLAPPAAAQALAGNIVDSIVRRVVSNNLSLAQTAAATPFGEVLIGDIGHALTLKPLVKSLVRWYASSGLPLPANFSRHVTAHHVGQKAAYSATFALVAIMLATSLTCQYQSQCPP